MDPVLIGRCLTFAAVIGTCGVMAFDAGRARDLGRGPAALIGVLYAAFTALVSYFALR
jgi:hypothetical protein